MRVSTRIDSLGSELRHVAPELTVSARYVTDEKGNRIGEIVSSRSVPGGVEITMELPEHFAGDMNAGRYAFSIGRADLDVLDLAMVYSDREPAAPISPPGMPSSRGWDS